MSHFIVWNKTVHFQIAAERLAYEAGEVFMNTVAPNDDLTAEQIQEQLFKLAVKAIDGTKN